MFPQAAGFTEDLHAAQVRLCPQAARHNRLSLAARYPQVPQVHQVPYFEAFLLGVISLNALIMSLEVGLC